MKKGSTRERRRVRKVLLVDDMEMVLKVWTRQTRRQGKVPLSATNRAEALAIARREKPDLAIVDLIIPNDSGIEIVKELKKLRPKPFVILVSGAMSAEAAMQGVEAGADDCYDKDVTVTDLIERVESGVRPREWQQPTLKEMQWQYIRRVLTDHGGNITHAAKVLGVVRQSLQRTISRLSPTGRPPVP
ncbi:MAG TPA: response regulator [Kofleriaceae bacterium]|nr:response regulator [Kofleriaceae bacterium]